MIDGDFQLKICPARTDFHLGATLVRTEERIVHRLKPAKYCAYEDQKQVLGGARSSFSEGVQNIYLLNVLRLRGGREFQRHRPDLREPCSCNSIPLPFRLRTTVVKIIVCWSEGLPGSARQRRRRA